MCAERLDTPQAKNGVRIWARRILLTLGLLALAFIAVLYAIYLYIPTVVYQPAPSNSTPEADFIASTLAHKSPKIVSLKSPDGTKLRAYWIEHPSAQTLTEKLPAVLFLHGNQGELPECLNHIYEWARHTPANFMLLRYRGYGYSEGSPSMPGLQMDSQTAFDHLIGRPEVDRSKIVVYGHSLGGAVALSLASKNSHHMLALIVDNTFLSIPKMATHAKPYLAWASFVVTDTWDNEEHLRILKKSAKKQDSKFPHILFLSGRQDPVVPPSHMDGLWDSAKQIQEMRKDVVVEFVDFPKGTHICRKEPTYYPQLTKFFDKITARPAVSAPKLNQLKIK